MSAWEELAALEAQVDQAAAVVEQCEKDARHAAGAADRLEAELLGVIEDEAAGVAGLGKRRAALEGELAVARARRGTRVHPAGAARGDFTEDPIDTHAEAKLAGARRVLGDRQQAARDFARRSFDRLALELLESNRAVAAELHDKALEYRAAFVADAEERAAWRHLGSLVQRDLRCPPSPVRDPVGDRGHLEGGRVPVPAPSLDTLRQACAELVGRIPDLEAGTSTDTAAVEQ